MKKISQSTISTKISSTGIYAGTTVEHGRIHRCSPVMSGCASGKRPEMSVKRGWSWPTEPSCSERRNLPGNCVGTLPVCHVVGRDGSDQRQARLFDAQQAFRLAAKLRPAASPKPAVLALSQGHIG